MYHHTGMFTPSFSLLLPTQDDALQAELFDLLGSADCFDFLIDLLAHRAHVVQSAADFMLIDMPPPALVASAAASSSSSSTAGRGAASGRAGEIFMSTLHAYGHHFLISLGVLGDVRASFSPLDRCLFYLFIFFH